MGNSLLESTDKYTLKQFDSWIEQKPELSGSKWHFESKIFHTRSYNLKNQNSSILMKIYLKENDFDQRNSQIYREQFEYIKKKFNVTIYPNILPFMTLLNFDQYQPSSSQQSQSSYNFVVVARQMIYLTLSDRYLFKPSLTTFDKNWILFQTLIAIYCIHTQENLFHGAIRSSNILLTTSNHAFITDFANYKPFYMNEENQIKDLRFFYKTHENNCTLAPEKFQNNFQQQLVQLDQISPKLMKELQSMDIFSLGCVISELYLEGEIPLFTYEQVKKFKDKNYSPESCIRKIPIESIQKLVEKIIMKPNEENRMEIQEILNYFISEVITDKNKIMFIYCLDVTIQSNLLAKPDFRIAFLKEMLPTIHKVIIQQESEDNINKLPLNFKFSLPLSLQKIDFYQKMHDAVLNLKFKIWEILDLEMPYYLKVQSQFQKQPEFDNIGNLKQKEFKRCWENFNSNQQNNENISLNLNNPSNNNNNSNQGEVNENKMKHINNLNWNMHNMEKKNYPVEIQQIVKLLCTNLRTVQYAATKLVGLEMLAHLSEYMSDYDVLHLILPFICDQLEDFEPQVAEYALEAFCKLLARLNDPFDSIKDTTLYKVFIWNNFQKCAKNMDIHRVFIINCIDLAKSCIRLCNVSVQKKKYLEDQTFNYNMERSMSVIRPVQDYALNIQKQEKEIIDLVKEVFKKCLSDCPADISNLAISQLSKLFDFLKDDKEKIDHITFFISCLNKADRKLSCLENMYDIILNIQDSQRRMFAILCLKDCLNDLNELFAYTALNCSWRLVEIGLLDKQYTSDFLEQIAPLILHPHNWIRKEAIKFIEVVITKMDPIQVFLDVQPKIIKYMTEDVAIINKDILRLIIPKNIDKKYIQYKTNNFTFSERLGDSDNKKYLDLFQQNYLIRVKSSKEQVRAIKDEECKQFASKFEITKSRQLYKQNFSKKLADFLIAAQLII